MLKSHILVTLSALLLAFGLIFVSEARADICAPDSCPHGSTSGYTFWSSCEFESADGLCHDRDPISNQATCVSFASGSQCRLNGQFGITPGGCKSRTPPCELNTEPIYPGCCPGQSSGTCNSNSVAGCQGGNVGDSCQGSGTCVDNDNDGDCSCSGGGSNIYQAECVSYDFGGPRGQAFNTLWESGETRTVTIEVINTGDNPLDQSTSNLLFRTERDWSVFGPPTPFICTSGCASPLESDWDDLAYYDVPFPTIPLSATHTFTFTLQAPVVSSQTDYTNQGYRMYWKRNSIKEWSAVGDVCGPDTITVVTNLNNPPACTLTPNTTQTVCRGDMVPYSANCTDSDSNLNKIALFFRDTAQSIPWTPIGSSCDYAPTGSANCARSRTWSGSGTFWVVPNAYDSGGGACSGNPWCSWEPGGTLDCSSGGWSNCADNLDDLYVTVQPIGSLAGTLTGTVNCSVPQSINLDWGDLSCASTYEVYRCVGSGCSPHPPKAGGVGSLIANRVVSNYSDTAVSVDNVYRYIIYPMNNGFYGGASNIVERQISIGTTSGLTASPSCPLNIPRILLNWNSTSCALEYQVYRCNNTASPGCTPASLITTVSTTSYIDTGVNAGTSYSYRIRPKNGASYGGYSSIVSSTVPFGTPNIYINQPNCTVTGSGVSREVDPRSDLVWTSASCATSYEVARCNESASPGCTPSTVVGTTSSLGYSDPIVNPNSVFNYSVRACNGATCSSTYSNTVGVGPYINVPSMNSVTASCPAGNPRMDVRWDNSGQFCTEEYRIQRCGKSGSPCIVGTDTFSLLTTIPDYTAWQYLDVDPGLQLGWYYSYRIRSCTDGYCTVFSAPLTDKQNCPTCNISLLPNPPSPMIIGGFTQDFNASPIPPIGTINSVDFIRGGPNSLATTVSTARDSISPYATVATGSTPGITNITASVNMPEPGGTIVYGVCTDTSDNFEVYSASCNMAINNGFPIDVSAGTTLYNVPIDTTPIPDLSPAIVEITSIDCDIDGSNQLCLDASNPATCGSSITIPSAPWEFDIVANASGLASVRCAAHVNMIGESPPDPDEGSCTDLASFSIYDRSWFQTKDGNATAIGPVNQCIPSTATYPYMIKSKTITTGFSYEKRPGMLLYSDIQKPGLCVGFPGGVSTARFNANSASNVVQDFDFFYSKLPSDFLPADNMGTSSIDQTFFDTNPGKAFDGYNWYLYDAGVGSTLATASDLNFGDKRIILFVKNADFEINNSIKVNDGKGLFMVIVENNLTISEAVGGAPSADPSTPQLEGLFVVGSVSDPATGIVTVLNEGAGIADVQLHILGSVVARDFQLSRDFLAGNATYPGEFFEFAPWMQFLVPRGLKVQNVKFTEVAP